MQLKISFAALGIILLSCGAEKKDKPLPNTTPELSGTWKLITGVLVEKGDTARTDYTKNTSFIKILNDTHFSFLQHDLTKGRDSATFVAGGGRYTLSGNTYTEHLEYCSARDWEGNDFTFTITMRGDTLVQSGTERVDSAGINRVNTETYVRVAK